jgi:hypothetical protein
METIHAAHNLTITIESGSWQLLNGTYHPDRAGAPVSLLAAQPGQITCSRAFAQARQLPADGTLVPADVARIVVGWAPESQNWHLGLLLAARPETDFKMRWCGLASWPRGQETDYVNQARQAGQALANLIDRPFHLIPPAQRQVNNLSETQPQQATVRLDDDDIEANIEAAVELVPPPYEFEEWVMQAVPKGYVWQRRSQWVAMAGLRAVFFAVLAGSFLVLGFGTQTRGLAPVEPRWLPWMGIGVAVMLIVNALRQAWLFLSVTDVIVDTTTREVRSQSRFITRVQWRAPFDRVAYVLVSQSPARSLGRKGTDSSVAVAQDVWVHLYDGQEFHQIATLGRVEGTSRLWDVVRRTQKTRGRRPLRLARYNSPAHQAAQVMAQAIGSRVWLDIR